MDLFRIPNHQMYTKGEVRERVARAIFLYKALIKLFRYITLY
jgi:hypothetical protein